MLTAAERESAAAPELLRRLPRVAGGVVLVVSAVVLLGWVLDVRAMQSFVPGLVTMKVNTALGLGLSALALLLVERRALIHGAQRVVARALAGLVVALGAGTLAEYVFHVDLRIDQLILRAGAEAALSATPGRMAAVTASAFVLLGAALLCIDRETAHGQRPAQWLALVVGAMGLTALLGYVYGVIPTVGLGQGIQIAIHTSIALVLLATGVMTYRPDVGWMPTLLSPRTGGVLARRLLPVAFVVPLLLGSLRWAGLWLSGDDAPSSGAAIAVATMIAFAFVIWRTAGALNEADRQSRASAEAHFEMQLREESARQRADAEHAARTDAELAREVAEQAGREKADALTLLDLLLESAPIGFAVFDKELRYQRVNRAIAAITGASMEAHIGRTVRDMIPSQADEIEARLQEVLATGKAVSNTESTGETDAAPGHQRHWLSSVYPIWSSDGEILGVGATVLETTELKHLEEQLQQGQRMKAIGQLAGGVAHDFNNLLTVITSYSGMLLADNAIDAATRSDVSEIKAAADRAAGLTRQLLAFSRQQVLQPQLLDINSVARNVERLLRRLIRENIELSTVLAPELGDVRADPGQLEQVMMNLVVNARDAMPSGGRITIETANVELDEQYTQLHPTATPGAYVMLAVSDTGCGMDAATQARIFEPFFTTKSVGEGTGLGLSTVYGIVQQSGGNVWVYSEPGYGTIFKIHLPRATEAGEACPQAPSQEEVAAGSETILLVEDEAPVRAVARRILQRAGYTVVDAANGRDALRVWEAQRDTIDLIVTDMVMPEMSGRDLANAVRATCPAMPLLFMSGYTEDAALQRSVLEPGNVFLEKPFTAEALTRKVRLALVADGDRAEDENTILLNDRQG